jgi:transcriptional regulator with XRE-family HTH domain
MEAQRTLTMKMKLGAAKYLFACPYTHTGVQRLIQWLMDSQGIGQFELSKRSGLSPAAIYQILNKSEQQVTRPPRKSTLAALAKAVGAEIHFDSKRNVFYLTQQFQLPKTEAKELSLLLGEIGSLILSRRRSLTKEERERIVRVVRAVL